MTGPVIEQPPLPPPNVIAVDDGSPLSEEERDLLREIGQLGVGCPRTPRNDPVARRLHARGLVRWLGVLTKDGQQRLRGFV